MTDGLRKSHLRKAPQVGLSEVGLPEGNQSFRTSLSVEDFFCTMNLKIRDL